MRPSRWKRVFPFPPSQLSSQIMVLFSSTTAAARVTAASHCPEVNLWKSIKIPRLRKNFMLSSLPPTWSDRQDEQNQIYDFDWQHERERKRKSNNQDSLESFITLCVISIYPPLNIKKKYIWNNKFWCWLSFMLRTTEKSHFAHTRKAPSFSAKLFDNKRI